MTVKEFKRVAKVYKYQFYHKSNFYSNSNIFDDFIIIEIDFDVDDYERIICTIDVIEKN